MEAISGLLPRLALPQPAYGPEVLVLSRAQWRWSAYGVVTVVLLVCAAIGVKEFDLNDLKPRIEEAVLRATGRSLALNGPLSIGWSLRPTLDAADVTLSNLPGGSRSDIARVERIHAQLSFEGLFRREIEITELTLVGPNILLERVGGAPNWLLDPGLQAAEPPVSPEAGKAAEPPSLPRIRAIHIQNGMITWRTQSDTKIVGIRSLNLRNALDGGSIDLAAVLVYSDFKPFDLQATAKPSGGLFDPWTGNLRLSAFDTVASASGTLDPHGPFDVQVEATSGALEKLNALLPQMRLPPLHGVTLSSHITNRSAVGELPVLGTTKLHVTSADLGAIVPGLMLGSTDLSQPEAGGTAILAAAGRFAGQPFALEGTAGIPGQLHGRSRIPLDLKARATPGGADRKAAQGSLSLKGTVALDALSFAGLDANAVLHTPALADLRPLLSESLPALTDVRFDGHITVPADRQSIAFKGAKLFSREGDVAGDWSLGLQAGLAVAGKLTSPRMDLDAMLVAFGVTLPPAPALAGASGPAISTSPLPWMRLRGPTIELAASVEALSFQGEVWKGVSLALHLRDGHLVAGPVSLSLPSGPVHAMLTVDAASDAVPIGLVLQSPGIPLSLVARYVGLPGPMQGAVRIDAQLRAAGHSPHEIAASLAGPVSASLINGRMTNAAFTILTAASLEVLGIKVPAQGDTALRCMGLIGSFTKGIGLFQTIALDTTWLQLDGSGQVDLGNETVAFKLRPLAQVSGSAVAVPVLVEGPFHAVRGRLDAGGLDKLGLFIDGLFGGDRSTACVDAGLVAPPAPNGRPD